MLLLAASLAAANVSFTGDSIASAGDGGETDHAEWTPVEGAGGSADAGSQGGITGEASSLSGSVAQPPGRPGEAPATIGQIEHMSKRRLEQALLSDPGLRAPSCARENMESGLIDRRVLVALEVLTQAGLDPTVSRRGCGRQGDGASHTASANEDVNGVTVAALNGVPISGHGGRGSLVELAESRLLSLPVALRPTRILAPSSTIVDVGTLVSGGEQDGLEVSFGSPPRASATAAVLPSAPSSSSGPAGLVALAPYGKAGTSRPRRLSPSARSYVGTPLPILLSSPFSPLLSAATAKPGVELSITPLSVSNPHTALQENVLEGSEELKAVAVGGLSPPSGAKYTFEYQEAESASPEIWQTIGTAGAEAEISLNTTRKPNGLYNFRVELVVGHETYPYELSDFLIANNVPVLKLRKPLPGNDVKGGIELIEEVSAEGVPFTSLTLEEKCHGSSGQQSGTSCECNAAGEQCKWHTIKEVEVGNSQRGYEDHLKLDTTTLPDGAYDFRVTPKSEEATGLIASIPVRDVLIDNTPPTVELTGLPAGSVLSGHPTLEAAASDGGSGVASVRFQERSVAGDGAWQEVGATAGSATSGSEVYKHALNLGDLFSGPYEFRAVAEDVVGNVAVSQPIEREVQAPTRPAAASGTLSGVLAPAHSIHLLGSVAASPEHEAWAYGFSNAPPAVAHGERLPYTAEGEQLVLLRYTDTGGWQIADVPRGENGEAFPLLPAGTVAAVAGGVPEPGQVQTRGAMAPDGEAWLWVCEVATNGQEVDGLFRRKPGGAFEYEPSASKQLAALTGEKGLGTGLKPSSLNLNIRLDEPEPGKVDGMLTAPGQEPQEAVVEGTDVKEALGFGLLQEGEWQLKTATPPPQLKLAAGDLIELNLGDVAGPGEAWATFDVHKEATPAARGLILGHLTSSGWRFDSTGLPALELTGALVERYPQASVEARALTANAGAVWIEASVNIIDPPHELKYPVVAHYEEGAGTKDESWCDLPGGSCAEPLGDATVPDAIFQTSSGTLAFGLRKNSLDIFANGAWTSVATPGYGALAKSTTETDTSSESTFSEPGEGWLAGANALGHWSAAGGARSLSSWPLPDHSTLTAVALPSGSDGAIGEAGALAVGFHGTALSYQPTAGWQEEPTPARDQKIDLSDVAFDGETNAVAVGQYGVILRWDGSVWSEDPQSREISGSQLNAVSFGANGEGWAVGADGTILHFNGQSWSSESPPKEDADLNITSVAVAGTEVFAVADGSLITLSPGQGWQPVPVSRFPEKLRGALERAPLRVVAGLPDGGVVAAGRSIVLEREGPGALFESAPQPLEGTVFALAPFREGVHLRTYVSVAPPAANRTEVAGYPPGDGELVRQTKDGWQDLSDSEYAGENGWEKDGAVKSDPVLAVSTGSSGEHAWAVGGYDGTVDAAGRGTPEPLSTRPEGWQTASIWSYDVTGSAQPPASLSEETPSLPAKPGTVSFAFFSSPMCKVQCSASLDAQPQVNLKAAATEIAAYASQEGGPAFAMLGGNAVGPLEYPAYVEGSDAAADFKDLPELLRPLGQLPTFAALGPFDENTQLANPTGSWEEAFAGAPPPFGSGHAASGITEGSSEPGALAPAGEVHRYYAFSATQNGSQLRVIVLDDVKVAKGDTAQLMLDENAPGQMSWLTGELARAEQRQLAVVVIASRPLRSSNPRTELAGLLAGSGVVRAVFTTDGEIPGSPQPALIHEKDQQRAVPEGAGPTEPQIEEFEGASLGYQLAENDGALWYFATINTQPGNDGVNVEAVPVIETITLKPLDGLSATRSHTLQFEAIARRPPGTLATGGGESNFEGFDDYVEIPDSKSCEKCVKPSYTFTSSEPAVGHFVVPTSEGSPYPKYKTSGNTIRTIPSNTSGLFCAFNAGTTIVTVTAGLLRYSLPVTVQAGNVGSPCGYEPPAGGERTEVIHRSTSREAPNGAGTPAPPPTALSGVNPTLSVIPPAPVIPPPAVTAPPAHTPAPLEPPPAVPPTEQVGSPPALVPPATPPVEPIPPGAGGYAQSPSAAERKEKARKHASQSAFVIRPAGTSGEAWFYGGVALATMMVLLLSARAVPTRPRPRPALADAPGVRERRRRR